MLTSSKKIIILIVLLALVTVSFFGFAFMGHGGPDGSTHNDCPLSSAGASLCPLDSIAMAIHHISLYQSFFEVGFLSQTAMWFALLIFAGLSLLAFSGSPPSLAPIGFRNTISLVGLSPGRDWPVMRWLSLLENSPSLIL